MQPALVDPVIRRRDLKLLASARDHDEVGVTIYESTTYRTL
jgi:hypothetical protein